MKIKLAILEKDINYLNRIVAVFNSKYTNSFEIYSFTDEQMAIDTVIKSKIDVLLADDSFVIDIAQLPSRCGFAYLVESSDIEMVRDQRAIVKFQKVDLIYKQILSIYSENENNVTNIKLTDDACKIVAFTSVSGGAGSSSMAVACALHYATQGKRVLYLNLESFSSVDMFLQGEGQFDMSDIIFALKSKKSNLSLKLESCVKQDVRGVYFYSQPKIALDMMELSAEDIMQLISELQIMGSYEYIVLDKAFGLDKDTRDIFRRTHAVVLVNDGSEVSNAKMTSAYVALATLEQDVEASLLGRLMVVYNKFSNKTGKVLTDELGIRSLGGAPRYEHASTDQVVKALAEMSIFDGIF